MHAPRPAFALGAVAVVACSRASPSPQEAAPAESVSLPAASSDLDATPGPVALPSASAAPSAPGAEPRLGWPADGRITGVYASIDMLGARSFLPFLDRVAKNGMNAVVFDGKDYSGWLTYPSAIPLAVEARSSSHKVLASLEHMVHEAHRRDVRVLLRVACFHDPWLVQHRPDLGIRGMSDWADPSSEVVQGYLLAVVDETLAAGVDEIQLDYVRYPTEGLAHADFALGGKSTTDVIAGFVQRVHERTHAAGVPLSLDIFGVVAWQRAVDVKATGQDLEKLGAVVEVVSPMVYPSHFREGFNGYAVPGAHPEVVGIGTKQTVDVLRKAGSTAIVRPWIQAFPWHAPGYDASYVIREIALARASAGVGWLGWNAGPFASTAIRARSPQRKRGSVRRARPSPARRGRPPRSEPLSSTGDARARRAAGARRTRRLR